MGWHYIDPGDIDNPAVSPEIEVWPDLTVTIECKRHGQSKGPEGVINADDKPVCPECGKKARIREISCDYAWYYWFCVVGCEPVSEPFGPYSSEDEALVAARSFCDISD